MAIGVRPKKIDAIGESLLGPHGESVVVGPAAIITLQNASECGVQIALRERDQPGWIECGPVFISSLREFNARVPNVTDIKEPAISKSVLDIKIPLFHVGRATVFIEREWEVVSTRCSRRREKSVQGDRSGRVIAKALSGIVSREVNEKLQLVPIVRGVKNSPSAPDHKAVRGAVGKAHSRRKVSMVGIQNAVRYLSEVRILDLRNSRVKPPFSLIGIGCRGCVLIS